MSIAYRASGAVSVQGTTASIAVPGAAQVGDRAYILAQTGGIGGALGLPAGWTSIGTLNSGTSWYALAATKVLTVSDLGSSVTFATPGTGVKTGIEIWVGSGLNTASDYDDVDFAVVSAGTAHITASVLPTGPGDWILGMYLERNTSPTVTPPGAFSLRAATTQTGGASVVGSVVDSNGAVSVISQNAGTFTSDVSSANGVALVVALKSASTTVSPVATQAYDSYAEGLLKGDFDMDTDTYKMILVTPSYVFDKDTHVFYSDISAYECATSNGYTVGGQSMTGVGLFTDGPNHRKVWDSDPVEWVASGGNLPSTIGAVIFKSTGVAGTSRLIWWCDAGGTISSASVGLTAVPDADEGWGYLETPVA